MQFTRRALVGRSISAIGLSLGLLPFARIRFARAQTSAETAVSFRWRVPDSHFQTVKDSLAFEGTVEQERDTKGLPLIAIIIGVAMLPSLADALLNLRRKLEQPGLKIDARNQEIKIDVDPTLPRGMILLVDSSGAKLYDSDQLTDPLVLAKTLAASMGK